MGVILTYNANPEAAMRVVDDITAGGGTAVALPLDVSNTSTFGEFRDTLQAAIQTTWGRADFDALINNAGYGMYSPIASVTEPEFDALFNVHLKGPFFLTQALLPLISDGGQIVNMASATSRVATPGLRHPRGPRRGVLSIGIDRVLAFDDVQEAHRILEIGRLAGKLVLRVDYRRALCRPRPPTRRLHHRHARAVARHRGDR